MKRTKYFVQQMSRPDRSGIRREWIEQVLRKPLRRYVQQDGRSRLWGRIVEAEGRYLRVVVLEDGETVHNAFFDRRFKVKDDET